MPGPQDCIFQHVLEPEGSSSRAQLYRSSVVIIKKVELSQAVFDFFSLAVLKPFQAVLNFAVEYRSSDYKKVITRMVLKKITD